MDWIRIESLQVHATIGVHDWEQQIRQALGISVSLGRRELGATDRLTDTIDYAAVVVQVRDIAARQPYQLIEHLAQCIAEELVHEHAPVLVRVDILKPDAIPGASGITCTVTRASEEQRPK